MMKKFCMRTFALLFIIFLGFSSCEKYRYEERTNSEEKFVPTDVLVKTKGYYTIDKVFEFINLFDHDVESIKYGFYTSSLPLDSLQYILDYLNAKPYTHDGVRWHVTGYTTDVITIFPKLFKMKNKEYQADWLQSMEILKLAEKTNMEGSGNIIFFHVPVGKEKDWVEKFKKYDFVEWAELNYIVELNPWP
jgi:hypothetical protein